MTQPKLQILGPYTPEHEGPFCIDDEAHTPVELKIRDGRGENPLKGYVGDDEHLYAWTAQGRSMVYCLMNAREVPVAREFWDVNWKVGRTFGFRFDNLAEAMDCWRKCADQMEIIHVREVLPGDGE